MDLIGGPGSSAQTPHGAAAPHSAIQKPSKTTQNFGRRRPTTSLLSLNGITKCTSPSRSPIPLHFCACCEDRKLHKNGRKNGEIVQTSPLEVKRKRRVAWCGVSLTLGGCALRIPGSCHL